VPSEYYPVLIALAIAFVVGGAMLIIGSLLNHLKSGGKTKLSTYESGLPLLDRSQKRLSILFFLIAIDFVIFDVEAAFLYPWALVLRDGAWPLFWAVMAFVAFILVGYAYVWKRGGLELKVRRPLPGALH
jgi:NADH:ubiquinone oxidoreductase subunit 3 (subunit A)